MKKIILILAGLSFQIVAHSQTISIASSHTAAIGVPVTVKGIAVNGAELGVIRYLQDGTGGVAVRPR